MITLFGREREMAQVDELVDRGRTQGGTLLVRGAAGIGKSALLTVADERAAARGLVVLSASGVQGETYLAFAGLHQLVQPLLGSVRELPVRQREALLGAFGLDEVRDPEPFHIALAVLNLLSDMAARRPLLLVVDDLQWLDRPTAEVLAFVARRVRAEPIALLMAARDRYATILDNTHFSELALGALAPSDAEALLDSRAPELSPSLRRRVLTEAAGNPLALVELPLALDGGRGAAQPEFLPLTVRLERSFAVRLAELPPRTRTLLLAAAANDGHDLGETLAAARRTAGADVSPADLLPAADLGLVSLTERAVQFRHPLVRSAIYQQAEVTERRAVHAALSEVHDHDHDRRAWHRAAALGHRDDSVAAELENVAVRAQQRGAITVAVTALRRSADISEKPATRAERLLRAAELAFELGNVHQVAELLALAEPELQGQTQRTRLAWLSEVMEEGRNEGPARVRRLIGTAEASDDRALALNFVRAAALRSFWNDPGEELRQRIIALAERLATGPDDPALIYILATADPVENGAEVMKRLAGLLETQVDAADARILAVAAHTVGAFELGDGFLDVSIADLRAQGRLGLLAQALGSHVWTRIFRGHLADALLAAEESERLAFETRLPRWQSAALGGLAMLAALRGEEERAHALVAEGERVLGTVTIRSNMALLRHARGMIALNAGQHEEAFGHLWRVYDPGDTTYHSTWRQWMVSDLVDAAVTETHRETARAAVAGLEVIGGRTPAPILHTGLRYARAVLADDDRAEQFYLAALAADLTEWPAARARLLLAYGMWLRRRRHILDARVPLRTARDTCDALGLLTWGEKARQELRATGESSEIRVPATTEQLTPQELHIAKLAAGGLSNREIGQQLYLSHRTVGTHLYNLFRKLGITSRAQLRDVL
ncbi:LuxR family transcriptional regulator [Streptosporangium sp. 'caverna']|uniref:helix-turn-helix transcriptional regulator n=1 Tax=Streptosporangium sp. 'caverna' TaxID=2202249 RepID=UPI0013A6FA31|nr:LuxR family transcriptional regulator [Streptosporangium sp. 'caverna']